MNVASLPAVSKRGLKRDSTVRNACHSGWRNDSRVSVGSFDVRSLKGDKWKLACHEFASRNFFICGISERWMSGSGILVDDESGVRFIYVCHEESDNSKSGKHGVGFMLSWKARGPWRDQGARVNRVSPRTTSLVTELADPRGTKVPFFFCKAMRSNRTARKWNGNLFGQTCSRRLILLQLVAPTCSRWTSTRALVPASRVRNRQCVWFFWTPAHKSGW